jgi:mRNA interferase HigB
MRVHLIKEATVKDFVTANASSKTPFEEWLTKVKAADWSTSEDMQKTFGSADLLGKGSSRVIFNIGGNNYRMICKYGFGDKEVNVFVCWIGTHTEYSQLCKQGKQYTINIY